MEKINMDKQKNDVTLWQPHCGRYYTQEFGLRQVILSQHNTSKLNYNYKNLNNRKQQKKKLIDN